MGEWMPIESAPRDGRPVWVRGWNFGKVDTERHHLWAWWNGSSWICPSDQSTLLYLTDYMPPEPPSSADAARESE